MKNAVKFDLLTLLAGFKKEILKFRHYLKFSALLILSNNISIFAALLCICIENLERGTVLSTTLGLRISTA